MKRGHRLSSLLALVFTFVLRVPVSRADVVPPVDGAAARREAAAHFARGVAHADAGAWNEAAAEFQAAYGAVPLFSVLYNLGQSFMAGDRPVEALDALERYLAEGGDEVPSDRRSRVNSQLALLRQRVGTLQVSVVPADALVAIDGRRIPEAVPATTPRLVRLLPGAHTISGSRDGHQRRESRVQLETGQTLILELTLAPLTVVPAQAGGPPVAGLHLASPETGARTDAPGPRRALAYGLGATSVALGGAALGLYLWNDDRYADWQRVDKKLESNRDSPTFVEDQQANNELWRSVERVDWIIRGLAAGTVVAATLATIVLVRRARTPSERTAGAIVPTPGGAVGALEIGW
jgi:hypothetical protein